MDRETASETTDETARRLMRQGWSDEAIAERTGLPLIRLLALRAHAAVEGNGPRPLGA